MTQAARLLEQALYSLAIGDRAAARRQIEASLALHRRRLAQAIRGFLDTAADTELAASGHAQPPTSIRKEDACLPA